MTPISSSAVHSGRILAPDEMIVWQGKPEWTSIGIRALYAPVVAAYFLITIMVGVALSLYGRLDWQADLGPLASGMTALVLVAGLASLISRSTTYCITDRRVIMRYGIAFPRCLSLPLSRIHSMSVSVRANGRGDVALSLKRGRMVPYLKLWPHVRPWHLKSPQPMLRDITGAGSVSALLARLLYAARVNRDLEVANLSPDTASATYSAPLASVSN